MDKQQAIGGRIAQARKETGGMTQEELAALLHVSVRSVQAYESGEVVPYRQMSELERVLGKPVAWFLHGDAAVRSDSEIMDELQRQGRVLDRVLAILEAK